MKYEIQGIKNKVCVITGGAGVIGTSLGLGLAEAGAKVAIVDFNLERAKDVADEINKKSGSDSAIGIFANVLDKDLLLQSKKEINDSLGRIDALINGAGGNAPTATTKSEFVTPDNIDDLSTSLLGLEIDSFRKVFDLNFLGTVLPTMVYGEDLIKNGGSIINISSMNAFRPLTKIPAYSAAKAGINNLTEWLAVHFAKVNIRVNAIAPGFFVTDQNRFLLYDKESGKLTARGEKIINNTPMGRFGEPDELIGTLLYLVSDLSKFVTGVVIPVDGGFNSYSGV
ncbi:MAG: SDR family oxidoreductase [Ignavibacteriales bacterium]|nr:MAG: SDR family oxidoreductase [Ignavibacteriales bacterium]